MLTSRKASAASRSSIVRSETYGDLTKGAPVKITGESGSWRFLCHCVNVDTGSEWLDVFGGTSGAETLRAFKAERVTLIRPKQRGRRPAGLRLEDLI